MILAVPEAEAGESKVQGLPGLQSKFKACLGSLVRLCLKTKCTKRAEYRFVADCKALKSQRFNVQSLIP